MIISLDALQEYDRRRAETVEVMVRFCQAERRGRKLANALSLGSVM
jgi:hypothetical protein